MPGLSRPSCQDGNQDWDGTSNAGQAQLGSRVGVFVGTEDSEEGGHAGVSSDFALG